MVPGDSYSFSSITTPATYHISCLTFPKLSCIVTIKEEKKPNRKSRLMRNIKGIEELECVEEEGEEEIKDDLYLKE